MHSPSAAPYTSSFVQESKTVTKNRKPSLVPVVMLIELVHMY